MTVPHHERKHSELSPSGAYIWTVCPGSVALSRGVPDHESPASKEGTLAHEVLESMLCTLLRDRPVKTRDYQHIPVWMFNDCFQVARGLISRYRQVKGAEILVESRVDLSFIHPDMHGSMDGALIEYFGTLEVSDLKYGKYPVSPVENLQLILYGIGIAAKYDWNFQSVRLWIIQPRVRNYQGPIFWEIGIMELKNYVKFFEKAVARVEKFPNKYVEGSHCFFCKGKRKCPLKQKERDQKALSAFKPYE